MDERVVKPRRYIHETSHERVTTLEAPPLATLTPEVGFLYTLQCLVKDLSEVTDSKQRTSIANAIAKLLSSKAVRGGILDAETEGGMVDMLEEARSLKAVEG